MVNSGLQVRSTKHVGTLDSETAGIVARWWQQLDSLWWAQILTVTVYVRSTPHPVTVTTRIITFLVGNPYKPSFATVTGWGVDPMYKWCKVSLMLIFFKSIHSYHWLKLEICGWLRFVLSFVFVSTSPKFMKISTYEWRISLEDYYWGVFHQFFRGKCSRIARFQGRCAVTRRMMLLTMAKCGNLGARQFWWPIRYTPEV